MNKWQQVWSQREICYTTQPQLIDLIRLDGFDAGAGMVTEHDWLQHCQTVAERIPLANGDSVYEVGCGSGAFLLGLQQQRTLSKLGGLDFSPALIEVANRVFPDGQFRCDEAAHLGGVSDYDVVISHGVFHYFSMPYAESVLNAMIRKARKAVCILDIPDLALKEASEKMRRDILSEEEYNKKYADLPHTYYPKDWFVHYAQRHQLPIQLLDGMMPNYAQRPYRFGCLFQINEPRVVT